MIGAETRDNTLNRGNDLRTRDTRMTDDFRYLIFPSEDGAGGTILSRPVEAPEAAYLRDSVIPHLQALSDHEYQNGPLAILSTFAHFSYVLQSNGDVYWCVEWGPGLLVVRFSPSGSLSWCALRSPNPEFGGRTASEAELDAFDEDAPNPQYNLVFDAWDPQLEPDRREGWQRATGDETRSWEAAMAHAETLGDEMKALGESESQRWLQQCRQSPIWQGSVVHG